MDKNIIKAHKIDDNEYEEILKILKKEPNLLELGIIGAMWSEHCSYKSSKYYLNGFPTKADWVIQGPGENAGVIDIGSDMVAVFKIESHNHPSFIEPFAGAATGVGGIMRDIFTMGARVVVGLNSLKFGNIHDKNISNHQKFLIKGVASGIAHYGNCMGVPTIGGECSFDECFNGNILVNAFALGICKKDEVFYAKAEGIGNPIIYVGSKTGRDGLGGAVMASDSFDSKNKTLRPTVQIGDPFTEKLLMEACLELFKHDFIVGIQDMGAAGLTSSSFEMAGKSGSGIRLWLDKVPMRENDMTPYELMLSESQERMLICAKKNHENDVIAIFKKWGLDAVVIGEVTNTGKMELFWHSDIVGLLPIAPLSQKAPILKRPLSKPKYLDDIRSYKFILKYSAQDALKSLLSNENINDKNFIYEQFDSTVQTNTLKSDGKLGASIIRVKENNCAIAMGIECNSRLNYINPKIGAMLNVANAARKVICAGAKPLAISDCLNFGNPQNPEIMWQFAKSCEGIKQACSALNVPVVSGNVSLYNEAVGISIYPSPTIVCVGLNKDASNVLASNIDQDNLAIYLLGNTNGCFAGSLISKIQDNIVAGCIDDFDLQVELRLWNLILKANENKLLKTALSLGQGGIAVALSKLCALSDFGIKADLKYDGALLFDESPSRVLIAIEEKNQKALESLAIDFDIKCQKIATSTKEQNLKINQNINIGKKELNSLYFDSFKKAID